MDGYRKQKSATYGRFNSKSVIFNISFLAYRNIYKGGCCVYIMENKDQTQWWDDETPDENDEARAESEELKHGNN